MFEYRKKLSQNRLATRVQKRKNLILEHVFQLKGLSIGSFYEASTKGEKQSEESIIHYYPDSVSDKPYRVFEKKQLKRILAKAIDGLPRNERLVVSLYYVEELSTKEIGAILRVSQSRVLQLHTQAMLSLRSNLSLPK